MEVRQLPSTQALEAKLSRMSYLAAKDHEAMLRTVGKLTITDVAKISFFFCFVVSKSYAGDSVLDPVCMLSCGKPGSWIKLFQTPWPSGGAASFRNTFFFPPGGDR